MRAAVAPLPSRQRDPGDSLARLAAERANGVLVRECGALYLERGQVVGAESPLAPGLDVLLLAGGLLDSAGWQEAVERADEQRGVVRQLADSGRVPRGTLEICGLGALYDAAYFALAPSNTPSHFRPCTGHRLRGLRPVDVTALERETLRRRALLHRLWPDGRTDGAPLRRTPHASDDRLAPRQRAVLAQVDGVRTAADISRRLGRRAFLTLVDVRRLAAAGLVAPIAPEFPAGVGAAAGGGFGGGAVPRTGTGVGGSPTPRTSRAVGGGPTLLASSTVGSSPTHPTSTGVDGSTSAVAGGGAGTGAGRGGGESVGGSQLPTPDPDITLLKRLRDALEAL